jgi:subtilisin-like proprotein convertase family protein
MKNLRYPLAAIACVLLLTPAAAHAGAIANGTGGTITLNGQTTGSPYPSTLKIEGGDGPITKVRPFLTITHSDPDALDLAVVSPTGHASVVMSDACGGSLISNLSFIFSQTAASQLFDNTPDGDCTSGEYLPSNFTGGAADAWPAPAPTTPGTNLDTFIGKNPNGDWKLFGLNDVNATSSQITSWGLSITTATANIVVPAVGATSGVANQYPLTKAFDTPDGQVIDDLNLKITEFNHQHPADVDMLLQAPTGEAVMAMSDACGSTDIFNGFNWTFDDEAANQFGDGTFDHCTDSSIKPSDFATPLEDMPAPAPARPYGATMATFDGLQGGTFRLFINDDAGGDTGYIDDWDVTMTTRPAAATGFAATTVASAEGQTAQLTVNRTGPANLGPATVDVGITDGETAPSDYTAPPAKLQFAPGETSKTISIPIVADVNGEEPETFFVTLANPTNDALLADATSFATVTIAGSQPGIPPESGGPDNRFTVGAAERLRNGSAQLPVTVPGAGKITVDDAGAKSLVKTAEASAEKAGTIVIKVKPEKRTKRKLRRGKKIQLTTAITYTPTGGSANSAQAPVTLKKKP